MVATSTAAEEPSPAPSGTVPSRARFTPATAGSVRSIRAAWCNTDRHPARYAAHCRPGAANSARRVGQGVRANASSDTRSVNGLWSSSRLNENTCTCRSARGWLATAAARSSVAWATSEPV